MINRDNAVINALAEQILDEPQYYAKRQIEENAEMKERFEDYSITLRADLVQKYFEILKKEEPEVNLHKRIKEYLNECLLMEIEFNSDG
jgi:hypothetical protein